MAHSNKIESKYVYHNSCAVPHLDFTNASNITDEVLEQYIPRLPSGAFDSCHLYSSDGNGTVACDAWIYDTTHYRSSRGMEWNFVCGQRWMGAVAQSAYMFGVFIGAITLGNAADKYGRKVIFCWSAILQLILGVGVALVPTYYPFLVIRFLYGIFGSAGSYITGFVLTMELVGASKRTFCGVMFQASFAMGIMLVAGWGYVIKDRQLLQVFTIYFFI